MENEHLNPALTGKFRIVHTHLPRVLQTPIGDIDFRTLQESEAEQLVEAGFYYLQRVEPPVKSRAVVKAVEPPIE